LVPATSYVVSAVFPLVGVLIGGLIAGGASIYVARKTREAAERDWVRDSRREVFDRFLSRAQRLLIACEATKRGEGDEGALEGAFNDFFEAYGVIQTVADLPVVEAARRYAYLLWELRESLRGHGVLPSERFSSIAPLVRESRHKTIEAMRVALGLEEGATPPEDYNPFEGLDPELGREWAAAERKRPGCGDGARPTPA
jgi:hypothetical protein